MTGNVYFYKIGGSCLTGAEALRNLADIAGSTSKSVFVVSAFEKVTDSLLSCYNHDRAGIVNHVHDLISLHAGWLTSAIGHYLSDFSLHLLSGSANPHPGKGEEWNERMLKDEDLPEILSIGERLSAATCTAYLNEIGYKAAFVPSDLLGLIACRKDARILPDIQASTSSIRRNVNAILAGHDLLVTTGFFAPDTYGKIQTFGRNSSDLSAVAFAGAYGSSHITLFKDVNGIYNVDPKTISERAFLYEVLSHDAAISIATGGSKIVHPAAIELAKTLSIDIRVRNFVHKSTPEGTLITSNY
jgi:aspartate kinase